MMWKFWNQTRTDTENSGSTAVMEPWQLSLRVALQAALLGRVNAPALQAVRAFLLDHTGAAMDKLRQEIDLAHRSAGHQRHLPRHRPALADFIADYPGHAILFLTHWDGFVREAALRALSLADASPAVALLVLERCNDWVPQLRPLAKRRLDEVMVVLPAERLKPVVVALLGPATTWQRWGNDPAQLTALFAQANLRRALKDMLLFARDGPVVRQARWAMRLGVIDDALPDLALNACSGAVRAVVIQSLLDGKAYWTDGWEKMWIDKPMGRFRTQPKWYSRSLGPALTNRSVLLCAGADDQSVAVRRVVADHLCKVGPNQEAAAAIAVLMRDQNPTVAQRMQYFSKKWANQQD
jgi:hypothetical protein